MKRTFELSLRLSISEFISRHEASIFGLFWYLLNPLLTFTVLYVLFSGNLGSDIDHYAAYLIIGIIVFRYVERVVVESTKIIRENAMLIKSIPFSRIALPLGVCGQYAFSLFIEIGILLVVGLISGIGPSILWAIAIAPFIIMLGVGLSLAASPLAVYIRDLEDIVRFATWLLFFATPVFYSHESVIHLVNPLAYMLEWSRTLIFTGEFLIVPFTLMAVSALIALVIGTTIYQMNSRRMTLWI